MFFYKIVMKLLGWKVNPVTPEEYQRCVLIGAPHTSNWDFIYTMLSFKILKIPYKFTIKKEWFRFPFNLIIKPLGGIPIDTGNTSNTSGTVLTMASYFKKNKNFVIAVTPEGSRSKRTEWKSGFYHLAKMANVPICLGYIDYKNKIAGVGDVIYPSEDITADMKKIMAFYKGEIAKFPEKFSIDIRYK
jgi:1-acyl-sn-glycerol-3-phosphate acyltransferase